MRVTALAYTFVCVCALVSVHLQVVLAAKGDDPVRLFVAPPDHSNTYSSESCSRYDEVGGKDEPGTRSSNPVCFDVAQDILLGVSDYLRPVGLNEVVLMDGLYTQPLVVHEQSDLSIYGQSTLGVRFSVSDSLCDAAYMESGGVCQSTGGYTSLGLLPPAALIINKSSRIVIDSMSIEGGVSGVIVMGSEEVTVGNVRVAYTAGPAILAVDCADTAPLLVRYSFLSMTCLGSDTELTTDLLVAWAANWIDFKIEYYNYYYPSPYPTPHTSPYTSKVVGESKQTRTSTPQYTSYTGTGGRHIDPLCGAVQTYRVRLDVNTTRIAFSGANGISTGLMLGPSLLRLNWITGACGSGILALHNEVSGPMIITQNRIINSGYILDNLGLGANTPNITDMTRSQVFSQPHIQCIDHKWFTQTYVLPSVASRAPMGTAVYSSQQSFEARIVFRNLINTFVTSGVLITVRHPQWAPSSVYTFVTRKETNARQPSTIVAPPTQPTAPPTGPSTIVVPPTPASVPPVVTQAPYSVSSYGNGVIVAHNVITGGSLVYGSDLALESYDNEMTMMIVNNIFDHVAQLVSGSYFSNSLRDFVYRPYFTFRNNMYSSSDQLQDVVTVINRLDVNAISYISEPQIGTSGNVTQTATQLFYSESNCNYTLNMRDSTPAKRGARSGLTFSSLFSKLISTTKLQMDAVYPDSRTPTRGAFWIPIANSTKSDWNDPSAQKCAPPNLVAFVFEEENSIQCLIPCENGQQCNNGVCNCDLKFSGEQCQTEVMDDECLRAWNAFRGVFGGLFGLMFVVCFVQVFRFYRADKKWFTGQKTIHYLLAIVCLVRVLFVAMNPHSMNNGSIVEWGGYALMLDDSAFAVVLVVVAVLSSNWAKFGKWFALDRTRLTIFRVSLYVLVSCLIIVQLVLIVLPQTASHTATDELGLLYVVILAVAIVLIGGALLVTGLFMLEQVTIILKTSATGRATLMRIRIVLFVAVVGLVLLVVTKIVTVRWDAQKSSCANIVAVYMILLNLAYLAMVIALVWALNTTPGSSASNEEKRERDSKKEQARERARKRRERREGSSGESTDGASESSANVSNASVVDRSSTANVTHTSDNTNASAF